jgi:hypothetical protein
MTDVNQDPAKLASFNANAKSIAQEFVLDVEEVKTAFGPKPDSLSTLFNSMSEAKKRLNLHKAATIVGGLVTVGSVPTIVVGLPVIPAAVTAYCGLKWHSKTKTLDAVEKAVKAEISASKGVSAPVPAAL